MGRFIMVILGLFNNGIPMWVGYSIYNITENNFWFAITGIFITYAVTSQNPLLYLISFPIFEYFYGGSLTVYSYIYIGLVILNIITVLGIGRRSYEFYE